MSFIVGPDIYLYKSFAQFVQSTGIGENDLIVSNKPIIAPYLDLLNAGNGVLYVEDYGTGEPTNSMINTILGDISGKGYKRIIAIGGGAVIDISKQLRFEEGLSCEDLYARVSELAKYKQRELIAVPTTCGTGSEVTAISVALFPEKKTKIGLVSPALYPNQAVLVPDLLASMPYDVFAASSVDALIHAVESYVSPKADAFSELYSVDAIRRILNGYQQIVADQTSLSGLLEDFSIASCYAGIAFSNAGCGGVHALSFPLGGTFHVPHGKSNYYLFMEIFKKYVEKGADLSKLERLLEQELGSGNVWENLETLLEKVLPRVPLSQLGVTEKDIDEFVPSVVQNQQRLLVNMPVPFDEEDMKQVYRDVL